MKNVSKKAYYDLVRSVTKSFKERKNAFLYGNNYKRSENFLDKLNYVESVENLLLSYFMITRPLYSNIYEVMCLQRQIDEIMCQES